ncbi:MAG: hypothetical protein ACI86H_001390 [bacterium]|jgi:hypothetical protein
MGLLTAELGTPDLIILSLIAMTLLFLGYKIGSVVASLGSKKTQQSMEKDSHNLHKSLKKILEEEKNQLLTERDQLKIDNESLSTKLEDYRKKLAGMGMLNFSGNKKRADILYSLLLENEALEQLLSEQGEKLATEREDFLRHRLQDIRKRQRLMAEIFNDDTIKSYVQEVLMDESKMADASENLDDGTEQKSISTTPEKKALPEQ